MKTYSRTRQCAKFEVPITLETSFEDDLGITGDDGEDLIVQFGKRYDVDISNFYFTKYFYPKPPIFVMPDEIKGLRVVHLMKAIAAGRLDDDVING